MLFLLININLKFAAYQANKVLLLDLNKAGLADPMQSIGSLTQLYGL